MDNNIKNNFLPESNFIIIPTEIDTEDLSGDEALCYYTLTYDKLMEIDKEHLAYFYNKEMPLSYTFAVCHLMFLISY